MRVVSAAWQVLAGAAAPLVALLMLQATPGAAQADEPRAKIQFEMEEALRRRQEILERILVIGSGIEARSPQSPIDADSLKTHRAGRAELLAEPPLDAFDQGCTLLEQTMATPMGATGDRSGNRKDIATLFQRHSRRNQGAASFGGFNHQYGVRESADDPVALREEIGTRRPARWVLAGRRPVGVEDPARQATVSHRIAMGVAGTQHRHGAAVRL